MYRSLSVAAAILLPGGPAQQEEPVRPPLAGEAPATAPVLDLGGKVIDIAERVSNLDESVTNETSGTRRTITVAADVLFAFGKATLTGKAKSRLAETAEALKPSSPPRGTARPTRWPPTPCRTAATTPRAAPRTAGWRSPSPGEGASTGQR
ncbi:hypothetical protein [Nonomuraea sp. NPDC049504]|uniref:hypothetical protein n=1 Tax=Nonomuraea sp. NPDC049504 TaxID=3154729 RepID=UPI00342E8A2F